MNNLVFCDLNIDLIEAIENEFGDVAEYIHGPFEDTDGAEIIVSAANSFGIMDGGIDLALSEYFGWNLESDVQKYIRDNFGGCQPVGTAFLIETGSDTFPTLVHAPTMIVPETITDTANVYWAMRAILTTCKYADSVMCPGLGCGAGEMDVEMAAKQMHLAYMHLQNSHAVTWERAVQMREEIANLH